MIAIAERRATASVGVVSRAGVATTRSRSSWPGRAGGGREPARRGRAAAGRRPRPPGRRRLGRAAGPHRDRGLRRLRPRARRGVRAGRERRPGAVRLRRAPAELHVTSALPPACGCGTTSRPARLELNAKSADLARSAWAGAGTRDFTDVDVVGARGRPGAAPGLGRSARSTCPPGGTRRCCRRPPSPT